jgi:uncharacterized membrane protein YkvI
MTAALPGSVAANGATWFQRFLLPGFAFKAVVIGGGYATGRELAEFFLGSGPRGGLMGMLLAMLVWSAVCAGTFTLAHVVAAYDYRSLFKTLLGPFWWLFEIAYLLFVVLILAVFGAAAGEIGGALFGWPLIIGSVILAVSIVTVVTFGNHAVEGLFKYVSILLYAVYALFIVLAITTFGDRIDDALGRTAPTDGWALGGLTYASYNVVGAVVILPMMRHLTSRRDAIIAGLVAGPLAMVPALLFFMAMIAFYPGIETQTLPSDFILRQLDAPWFHVLFQGMIFAALLESGVGSVHAINERIHGVLREQGSAGLSHRARAFLSSIILLGCIFVADRIGLVALIGSGYRFLAYVILAVYIVPLVGWWLLKFFRLSGV